MNFKPTSHNIFTDVVSGKIKPEFLRKQNGIKFLMVEQVQRTLKKQTVPNNAHI
jgi:hypothetical protein